MTKRVTVATLLLLLAGTSVGCAPVEEKTPQRQEAEEPVSVSGITWEEAKATAQAMEAEITSLIPANAVIEVNQRQTGTLFSCSETEWRWKGSTTVTMIDGTEIETIVKSIQAHYENTRFDISTRIDSLGNFEVALSAPTTAENYLVGEGFEPNQIRIDSGSACFTLPEDVWPGGDF